MNRSPGRVVRLSMLMPDTLQEGGLSPRTNGKISVPFHRTMVFLVTYPSQWKITEGRQKNKDITRRANSLPATSPIGYARAFLKASIVV